VAQLKAQGVSAAQCMTSGCQPTTSLDSPSARSTELKLILVHTCASAAANTTLTYKQTINALDKVQCSFHEAALKSVRKTDYSRWYSALLL